MIERPVALAPMAGITDAPLRRQVRRFGADMLTSEMIASRECVSDSLNVRAKATLAPDERRDARARALTSVQLAGNEPEPMRAAAAIAEDLGAEVIDVNMGCPAKKVTNGYAGAALMRAPELAVDILRAVIAGTRRPVTLKMRLGWCEETRNAADLARRAEEAGVALITVHGRTRRQFYEGAADWSAVRCVVDAVSLPVLVNGDVVDAASARAALTASGAAGVMVGRAALARPWLPAQIAAELSGETFAVPTPAAQAALACALHADMTAQYGDDVGVRMARKHLSARLALLPGGDAVRAAIIRERDPEAVRARLSAFAATLADAPPDARTIALSDAERAAA